MSKKVVYNLRKTTRSVVRASSTTSKLPHPTRRSDPLPPISEPKSIPCQKPTMDSGNDSGRPTPPPLTPTVSGFGSVISTTFKPKDVMAFVEHLPTFDGTPRQLERFITSVEEILMLWGPLGTKLLIELTKPWSSQILPWFGTRLKRLKVVSSAFIRVRKVRPVC